ncbi:hypothetical protein BDR26DRAFT_152719 [Obelidium mucronatum]|nr:hypothetical protein BDR26DRAFT_152719 [Obelidium mucronatum]
MHTFTTLFFATALFIQPLLATSSSGLYMPRCQDNKSTLVFRSLTNKTLTVLQSNNLSATFFITPSWAKSKKNKDLAANALQQGHNLGLAIPSPESLIKKPPPPPKCNAGMCDHSVNYPKLNAYLKTATADWKRELGRLITKKDRVYQHGNTIQTWSSTVPPRGAGRKALLIDSS